MRCSMGCRRNRDCHTGRSFSGRRRGRSGVPSHNGAKQRARRSLLRYCRVRLRLAQICKSAWAADLMQARDVVHCRSTSHSCSKIAHGPSESSGDAGGASVWRSSHPMVLVRRHRFQTAPVETVFSGTSNKVPAVGAITRNGKIDPGDNDTPPPA